MAKQKNNCAFVPSKGANQYKQLLEALGKEAAYKVFLTAINPDFQIKYADTLNIDSDGIPTLESLMEVPYIQYISGDEAIAKMLEHKYELLEDTRENMERLVAQAQSFNTKADLQYRKKFVATVEYVSDKPGSKLYVKIQPKTDLSIARSLELVQLLLLNKKLLNVLQVLGITISDIEYVERNAGLSGVVDFSKAKNLATGCDAIIKTANDMEGQYALSEEVCHLLVRANRKNPLFDRYINALSKNEQAMRTILGEEEWLNMLELHDSNMLSIAEECLGQQIQLRLLHDMQDSNTEANVPYKNLWQRIIAFIKDLFMGMNPDVVSNALDDVSAIAGEVMRQINNAEAEATNIKQGLASNAINLRLTALSERIEKRISAIKKGVATETKLLQITHNEHNIDELQKLRLKLISYLAENADTEEGILTYMQNITSIIKDIKTEFDKLDKSKPEYVFSFLRKAYNVISAMSPILSTLNELARYEESYDDNIFTKVHYDDTGGEYTVKELLANTSLLAKDVEQLFFEHAKPALLLFLKPFFGEGLTIPYGQDKGQTITLEQLFDPEYMTPDISITDMFFDSMADSSNIILQVVNDVAYQAKEKARMQSIQNIKFLQSLQEKFTKAGMTDFDWIYERDSEGNLTGNYISAINRGLYFIDKRKELERLKKLHGDDLVAIDKGMLVWEKLHTRNGEPIGYENSEFVRLMKNSLYKEFYDAIMAFKKDIDKLYPDKRTDLLKAVQIRRSSSERFISSLADPSLILENIKQSAISQFSVREEEVNMVATTLRDFLGNEHMQIPIMYTRRLKNPNELSTDLFGTLMAYASAANNYKELAKIVNPLEITRTYVKEKFNIVETVGERKKALVTSYAGVEVLEPVKKRESNFMKKFDKFMASQVYLRYLEDERAPIAFTDNKTVSVTKVVNSLLSYGSIAQMGFNWIANLANVLTGISMMNIEAAAGEFFGVKDLAKADAAYIAELFGGGTLFEAGALIKNTKLFLFDELFNVRQDFDPMAGQRLQKKGFLSRVLSLDVLYLGQNCGDHWLYNRTAIAMAMKKQVLKKQSDGTFKQMSLWDALLVENYQGSTNVKKLNVNDIQELDGKPLNVAKFSGEIKEVTLSMFGVYNKDDASAANQVWWGRCLLQYRKWIKTQLNRRFEAGRRGGYTGKWREGYYRTLGRLVWALTKLQFDVVSDIWSNDAARANCVRGITEIVLFAASWVLMTLLGLSGGDSDDDDDKSMFNPFWMTKYAAYRLFHELGTLAPSFTMLDENLKTILSPAAVIGVLNHTIQLVKSVVWIPDYFDEIESGKYEGHSTFYRNLMQSDLPIVGSIKRMTDMFSHMDDKLNYYKRGSLQ